jgi:hypothetical protein
MANATLFYRTGTITDPQTTVALLPDTQKLEFTHPDNRLTSVEWSYSNNILDIPVPVSTGVRKINKQENGLKSWTLILSGTLRVKTPKDTSGDAIINNLKAMAKRLQLDSDYPFGNVGFEMDNAPEFNIDPTATSGLTLQSFNVGFRTPNVKTYAFSVNLTFGGTWTG